jgi:hypothetical protein
MIASRSMKKYLKRSRSAQARERSLIVFIDATAGAHRAEFPTPFAQDHRLRHIVPRLNAPNGGGNLMAMVVSVERLRHHYSAQAPRKVLGGTCLAVSCAMAQSGVALETRIDTN